MSKRTVLLAHLVAVVIASGGVDAQQPSAQKGIVRIDPALDAIVQPSAKLELLKGDYFGLADGPIWIAQGSGYLLFSDIGGNRIYKWTPSDRKLSVFLEPSGFTGKNPNVPYLGLVFNPGRFFMVNLGSNGLALDREGRVVFCAQGDRTIVRLEKDMTRTILVDRYEGKRINGCNDLTVRKSDGSIYFTDQGAELMGYPDNPLKELPYSAVLRWKDGQVQLMTTMEPSPNGIVFSPDEKYLYVSDTRLQHIARYDVQPDGTITNQRVFVQMYGDGLRVDRKGNLYGAGPDGVRIFSPEGKHLGTIPVSEAAQSVAFGDEDRKTLYVTSRMSLWRIRLNVSGF
jgi:gluconolactonase